MKTENDWTRALRVKAVVLFLAFILPSTLVAGTDIDQTISMAADGLVQVENLAGNVEFTAWDRNETQVRGEAGDSVEEVIIRETSGGVMVKIRNKKNQRNMDGTDLYLRIPAKASIEAEGVSSDFTVRGSQGAAITINTVSGDVEVEADADRVELNSVSGDVELSGSAKRVNAESVSGDVTLFGVEGEVRASTVSGDLSLEGENLSRGQFETVSGDMVLSVAVADDGRLSCDAMSGDVQLRLPASQQAAFNAQSYSGSIRSDFGEVVSVSRGPGSMLDEQVGNNSARIRVETFSGDVTIRAE